MVESKIHYLKIKRQTIGIPKAISYADFHIHNCTVRINPKIAENGQCNNAHCMHSFIRTLKPI